MPSSAQIMRTEDGAEGSGFAALDESDAPISVSRLCSSATYSLSPWIAASATPWVSTA